MKNILMACCFCFFLATLGNGCVTHTTRSRGAINANGVKINKDGECIAERTIWIWQKAYWAR